MKRLGPSNWKMKLNRFDFFFSLLFCSQNYFILQLRSKKALSLRDIAGIRRKYYKREFEPAWRKLTGPNLLRKIVYKWLEANPSAQEKLITTQKKLLIYASQYDSILGNGLEYVSTNHELLDSWNGYLKVYFGYFYCYFITACVSVQIQFVGRSVDAGA